MDLSNTTVPGRKRLTFYTNMPTPYQIDFFEELKNYFELTVVYFTDRENDRQWNLLGKDEKYKIIVLKNSWVARTIQKKIVSFHFSWAIIRLLLSNKTDFVICNGGYYTPNILLILLINKLRGKKVFYWSEPLFPAKSRISFLVKYASLFPVRMCTTAILAIGKKAIDCYKEYGYRKAIYNIPYNINISLFSRERLSATKLATLRQTYKANDEVVLITSCTLSYRKGVDTLVKAFSKIPHAWNARLLILGDGPDRTSLEKMASLSDSPITFLGFIDKDELPYYFALAEIFTFASRYDGWALVINEAIASDLAIICSNQVGAATDKLIHEYNALIFSPEDVDSLYANMKELILNAELRKRLVANGKRLKKEISSAYNAELIYGICNSTK